MRILVTGSEGSLAQMVIPKFQELGHSIVGCDNLSRHGIQCREKRYPLEIVDLADSSKVRAFFSLFGGAKEEFRVLEMAVEERFPLLNGCFLNIFRGNGFVQHLCGASAILLCGARAR